MTALWIVITITTIAITLMMLRLRGAAPAIAAAVVSSRPAQKPAPPPKGAAKPPVLPDLAWDAPIVDVARTLGGVVKPRGAPAVAGDLHAAQRARLRGRYLANRFPGVARAPADLLEPAKIIQSARLYFEERKLDRAIELLDLAIRQCPADESLPLARLEIAFLARDAALYVALAGDFRAAHASSGQWPEVARLGRAIAPEEALFGDGTGPRASDHYGPWPDMPNWIHAPWDLTAEVRATEFHQAMARSAA